MGYIYKITNDKNGKIYIGKTEHINPTDRWKEHLQDYKKERCEKRPIYEAMKKYGVEHFHFEVIEKTDNPEEREKFWINELRTYIGFKDCNGYNATLGGDGKSYLNLDEEEVIAYHIYIANYVIRDTAKHFNVDYVTIKKVLIKNNIIWLTKNDSKHLKYYKEKGGILQVSLNKKIVLNVFENFIEANKYLNKNPRSANISNACNGNHYAYGYLWYYGNDFVDIKDEIVFIM